MVALLLGCATIARIATADQADPTKPTASFTVSNGSPLTNETVTFTSTSEPGTLGFPITAEAWDLNDDGQFDDASGSSAQQAFSSPGLHTVSLQVTDENGQSSVASATVDVQNRLPSASFSISPGSPSTLETVTFTSASSDDDGQIAAYAWDLDNDGQFNDGAGSQAQRSFPFAGTYTVKLLVTDDGGGQDVATRTVDVGNQPPVAAFDYSPSSPSTGEQISLTSTSADPDGSITAYSWDLDGDNVFGDANGATAGTSFSTPGNHTVGLRVTDSDGASNATSQTIAVANRLPTAAFDFSPQSPKTGDQVTFTSSSTDPDGTIDTYAWDLDNDGVFDDGNGSTAKTSFASAGTHTVSLRVTDDNGGSDITTHAVDVGNRAPTASIGVSPSSPLSGQQVTLSSTSSDPDGSIVAYSWDVNGDNSFGDATTASTTASFATPGPHVVQLQVTDDNGASATASTTVNVGNRAPTAAFQYSPASPASGEQVTFTSTSSDPDGSIASLAWDLDNDGQFDDGTGTTAQTTFAHGGPHTVKLRVTDDSGASGTTSLSVAVANRPPAASFTSAPDAPKTGEQVTFTSTSSDPDGSIASSAWDLDNDGQFDDASGTTANKTFATAGTYTVGLRVTDDSGDQAVASTTVAVANRPPAASFTFSPQSPASGQQVSFTSTASDPDGSIASYSWDLDGDGNFGDAAVASPKTTYATPGTRNVRLLVTDNGGATDVVTVPVTVANRPPVADFSFPAGQKTLDQVTFSSTATDPDGSIAAYAWDLNGDGQYDDGTASTAARAFPLAGTYTVGLRVTDDSGASDTVTKSIAIQNQPPVAAFTTAPDPVTTDAPVTFTSTSTDPESETLTTSWDLDNNGSFETTGPVVQKQYAAPGAFPFKLKVVDPRGGSTIATGTITVPNRLPTATVDHTPLEPQTNTNITFTATAADPENRVKSQTWDLDNDGQFDDASGAAASKSFKKPGGYTVRYRIEDLDGGSTVVEHNVAVGNQAPTASFVVLPESPVAGTSFSLVSTAVDPDTPLEKWQWDLNGDGNYDDAEGREITHVFPAAGTFTVGLRVYDSEDVSNAVTRSVVVQPPPAPAAAAPAAAAPTLRLLSPFPVVRLAGRISKHGTRLRLFAIEAPPGARVIVACRGRGCPFRLSARSAGTVDAGRGKVRTSTSLRIRKLEKRVLRKGVRITIFVTKPGTIGKYVEFKFRKRRPPARIDRCLMPSAPNKPAQCPS